LAGSTNEACDDYSAIAGGVNNGIGDNDDAYRSFIGGGDQNGITARDAFVGAGTLNVAEGIGSFVGAGGELAGIEGDLGSNTASGNDSFVGAGDVNTASGNGAFVGGGGYDLSNSDSTAAKLRNGNAATGTDSFIGAGDLNEVDGTGSFLGAGGSTLSALFASTGSRANDVIGEDSFIGAGDLNVIGGNGSFIGAGGYASAVNAMSSPNSLAVNEIASNDSFIGAGDQNSISANQGFIGSGFNNRIQTGAALATIGGGDGNVVSGEYGAVTGGEGNLVSGTVAAVPGGYHNVASGVASFAAGYIAEALTAGSFAWSDESSTTVHVRTTAPNQFVARAAGGVDFYSNSALTSGVRLAPGSGTWGSLSDRAMKTGVVPLDDGAVLAKVAALPVSEWRYTSERGVRHVGPMAQDFYAAFGLGEDDRHITSIDEDGIALAAIKALHADNARLHRENERLHRENAITHAEMLRTRASDVARLDALERKVAALTRLVTSRAGR
jgi:hypothetical protein